MLHNVIRLPAALRDLEAQIDYLKLDSPETADRFLDSIETTFGFLLLNREVGQLC